MEVQAQLFDWNFFFPLSGSSLLCYCLMSEFPLSCCKEFKLNPNAKSFIPSPARPPTPPSDGSFYFPTNVTTVPSMPGMPMGIGVSHLVHLLNT